MCELSSSRMIPKTTRPRQKPPPPPPPPAADEHAPSAALRRRAKSNARQIMFSSWVLSRPFIASFIEDAEPGTTRITRANTVHNRQALLEHAPQAHAAADPQSSKRGDDDDNDDDDDDVVAPSPPMSSDRSDTSASSDAASDARRRSPPVRFAEHATVYAPGQPPVRARLRADLTLERNAGSPHARRKGTLASKPKATKADPRQPTSAGGRWLIRKLSQ